MRRLRSPDPYSHQAAQRKLNKGFKMVDNLLFRLHLPGLEKYQREAVETWMIRKLDEFTLSNTVKEPYKQGSKSPRTGKPYLTRIKSLDEVLDEVAEKICKK